MKFRNPKRTRVLVHPHEELQKALHPIAAEFGHVEAWECGWGVSSRGGSSWESMGVIGSQQQRVFVVLGSRWESLGAIGSR